MTTGQTMDDGQTNDGKSVFTIIKAGQQ